MKAAVYSKYGPPEVVTVEEIDKPVPKDNELLIKIYATTVSSGDWRARSIDLPSAFKYLGRLVFGIWRPRQPILGRECSGVVEAVGAKVTRFKVGDPVVAFLGAGGCHAEYVTAAEDKAVVKKPENISFEEAAAIAFGGVTALDFLRRGNVKAGEQVMVVGASGAVGAAAVQLAKHLGAEVTAVTSGANAELVRSLGADHVIDYTAEDFAAGDKTYDAIVDTTGTVPTSRARKVLNPKGRRLAVMGGLSDMFASPSRNSKGVTVVGGVAAGRPEDLQQLVDLTARGAYRPLIDSEHQFKDIVAAHRRVDSGRKRGNVVVTMPAAKAA